MQINKIGKINYNKTLPQSNFEGQKTSPCASSIPAYQAQGSNFARANFAPGLSFTGNAPGIKNAYIITGEENDVPLLVTKKNESYVVDFDSQAEIIYGVDAINYLNSHDEFEYDSQVIFPKKAEGSVFADGKEIPLPENSAVLINAGTKTKVDTKKGYPMIILSKKDYDWYERYGKNAEDVTIRNKFLELVYWNSHLYNGDFTPNSLLDENLTDEEFLSSLGIEKYKDGERNMLIYKLYEKRDLLSDEQREKVDFAKNLMDKLYEKGEIKNSQDGFVRFIHEYNEKSQKEFLKQKGFTEKELEAIMPIYKKARQAKFDTKFARKNNSSSYRPELIQKMKERGVLFNNTKDLDHIYWREMYGNDSEIRQALQKAGFEQDEIEEIVQTWQKETKTGFDLSGLKFINENMAVYNLADKLNNWTHEKTNWITNSTALSSGKEDAPFIGVSMVQYDDKKPEHMSKLRKEEKLHAHPNREEKRQTEIYVITSGAAALNVVKDGKSRVQILKEGDLAVVGPGVMHCVNSVLGEYEHIVAQVPSAFQYGFNFKDIVDPPEDYDEQKLKDEAIVELEEYASSVNQ